MTHKEILEEMFLIMKMNELYSAGNNVHHEMLWGMIDEGEECDGVDTPFGSELCNRFEYLSQQYWAIRKSEEALREEYFNQYKRKL